MFNKLLNPDYKKFYGIYKKLPGILAIIIAALFFIWSIVDLAAFSYVSDYYPEYNSYGVMNLDSGFLVLLIWWISGAITTAATWFFSVLVVSATVARTDATIEINQKLQNNNNTKPTTVNNTLVETATPTHTNNNSSTTIKPADVTTQTASFTSNAKKCPHCGAPVDSNVCSHCGRINFISFK